MKTPYAEAELNAPDADPTRVVTLEIHLTEAMMMLRAIDYFCRTCKKGYDMAPWKTAPWSHEYKNIIVLLRKTIDASDPEYCNLMYESLPDEWHGVGRFDPAPRPIPRPQPAPAREVHHHHYCSHPDCRPPARGAQC